MGMPSKPPRMIPPPPPADTTKAMLDAFSYAETQRKIRASGGRKGAFITQGQTFSPNGKSLLGT